MGSVFVYASVAVAFVCVKTYFGEYVGRTSDQRYGAAGVRRAAVIIISSTIFNDSSGCGYVRVSVCEISGNIREGLPLSD